jgi:hypothetical protein
MAGIDPELNRKLMATLRRCDAFASNAELRTVFVDDRLSPWKYNVPEAGSTYSRVQATIAFLHDKANIQGQNALVLLLQVLQDRYDPEDSYLGELGSLIVALGGAPISPPTSSPPSSLSSSASGNVDYEAGIAALLMRLGTPHPRHSEALVYQQRLTDNLKNSRLFGDTETRRAERAEIIMQLNALSLAALGVAFNELAGMSIASTAGPTALQPATSNITIIGDGNVIGSNNRVSVSKTETPPSGDSPISTTTSGLPDRSYAMKLFDLLTQYFSLNELQTLCFALGVNFEDLPSGGMSGKARDLISYCERRSCIPKLVATGKMLRPELDWS